MTLTPALPDMQPLIDELLTRNSQGEGVPPAELAARVQAIAALSTTDPDAIDRGLRSIDPTFADPARWALWAIWASSIPALDVLAERWGVSPMDRVDGNPVFTWSMSRNAKVWDWCLAHGVAWTERWDDDQVNHTSLPQGALRTLPLMLLEDGHGDVLRGLDQPAVQQDQDLLDQTLYTLVVESGGHRKTGHPGRGLDVLRRLLDLGANPLRVFDTRGNTPPTAHVTYLTGSRTIDGETLGEGASERALSPEMIRLNLPVAQRSSMGWCAAHWAVHNVRDQGEAPGPKVDGEDRVSPGDVWAILAPRVAWASVPVDAFGRTPLALALSSPNAGKPLDRTDVPDHDLGWAGRWYVQDLLAHGVALAGATPGWEPLRMAWANGARNDRWGPFWDLCVHHRDHGMGEHLSLPTVVGVLQDWATLWGEHLGKGWPKRDLSVRQARSMEQTARARALVQWAPESAQPVLKNFLMRTQDDLRGLMAPAYNTLDEIERFDAQARLLPETWTLRAEVCLHQAPASLDVRSPRPRL